MLSGGAGGGGGGGKEGPEDLLVSSPIAVPATHSSKTALNNACACAGCHDVWDLGMTTSHNEMAAFSKFRE